MLYTDCAYYPHINRDKKKSYILLFFVGWVALSYLSGHLNGVEKVIGNGIINIRLFLPLFAVFIAGALIYILNSTNILRFGIAIGLLSSVISIFLIKYYPTIGYQLAAPFIMTVIFVIANNLPSSQWIQTNDLSYGIYLISFPIQQLIDFILMQCNIQISFPLFFLIASIISILLSIISWKKIESPSLNTVKLLSKNN